MPEYRVDRARLPRVAKTDEGYLRGDAIVTRLGVFSYVNADGTIRKELRHPDDVLAADSLDSLKMIPITVDHPGCLVTAENAEKFSVGQTGENIRVDGRHIVAPITITHARGIAASASNYELSLGYRVDVIEETGVYNGEQYTHRQKNPVYNHLALVRQGRAGQAARLNFDGVDVLPQKMEKETRPMLKVNVDGIQYDAAPEVARALEKALADVGRLAADAETVKAERDKAAGRADAAVADAAKAKADLAALVVAHADGIAAAVKARTALVSKAALVVKGDMADKSDRQIMEAVVLAKHPDVKLDGKSDEYVEARFDAVVDAAATEDKAGAGRQLDKAAPISRRDSTAPDGVKARADALHSVTDMWKNPTAKEAN